MLYLRPDFAATLAPAEQQFAHLFHLQGELYREQHRRRTLRFLHRNGKSYYLKTHHGVGWKEIFKNLFQLRLPVVSAFPEWAAIQRLSTLGIHTAKPVGYGHLGFNPARLRSFLITEDVGDTITLEDLLRQWRFRGSSRPHLSTKWSILRKVAEITKTMHSHGINHRDFYLCHLRIDASVLSGQPIQLPNIYVMDLHRAQLRRYTPPERWIVKDLAGLYFSSMDFEITRRDLYRFVNAYTNAPLRQVFSYQHKFWKRVESRAFRMRRREHRMRSDGETHRDGC